MLKQKIQVDLTQAVKRDDEIIRSTLRMLLSAILNKEKEKRYKLSKEEPELTQKDLEEESQLADEEIIEVIASEIKKRKEAVLGFEKGERYDLIEKERKEAAILQKYMPEQLSEGELKKLAKKAIEEVGALEIKDMGKVMAEIIPKIKGKAEGGLVSKIVKELLQS